MIFVFIIIVSLIALVLYFALRSPPYPKYTNVKHGLKLLKAYHVGNLPKTDDYEIWRALKRDKLKALSPRDEFWSDKIKTFECLQGVENGVKMLPILWKSNEWNGKT